MQNNKHFVYILLTEKNTFYCGYTNNVERRFQKHLDGKGAKYTRANKPIKVVWTKEYNSKSEALKDEIKIKKLSHYQKEILITNNLSID